MLQIKNYADYGEIYIYGDIVTDTDASWIALMDDNTIGYQYPTKIKQQLDELAGKPITVHIASDGGDVSAGIAISNMLKNHNAPTTAIIDSWAASIASVIAFACNKIIMPENAFIMIHNPKAGVFGDSVYLRSIADWLDKIKDVIANAYATGTKTIDEIHELMDAETWFTAKEALDVFGDKIDVVDANNVAAVASLKTSFKNPYAVADVNKNIYTDVNTDTDAGNNGNNAEIINNIINVLAEAFKK